MSRALRFVQLWRAAGLRRPKLAVDASCYDSSLLQPNSKVARIHPAWRNTASCSADKLSSDLGGGRQTATSGRHAQQNDCMPASSWGSEYAVVQQQQELPDIIAIPVPRQKRSRRQVKRNLDGWIAQATVHLAPGDDDVNAVTAGVQGSSPSNPSGSAATPLVSALITQAYSMQAQLAAACAELPASGQSQPAISEAAPAAQRPQQALLTVMQQQEPEVVGSCGLGAKPCSPACSPLGKGACAVAEGQPSEGGSPRCNSSASSQHGYHGCISTCGLLEGADVLTRPGVAHPQAV